MANPATEGNSLLNPKRSRKLLKAVPLWTTAEHGKAGKIASQEGSSRAQREIASFAGDQPADEDQLKLVAGFRTARVFGTQGTTDAWLRDKK